MNSGNGDNGSQVKLADGNCAVAILGRDPSPKIFGAKIDGSTDDSAAVQALGNYLCTADGELVFPAATIKAHDINFPCALNVRGMGKGRTTLDYSAAANYGLQWKAPNFPVIGTTGLMTGGSLRDMTLKDVSSTATGVVVEGFFQWSSTNVYLDTPYVGIFSYGNNKISINHWLEQQVRSIGYYFKGDIAGVDRTNTACTTSTTSCTTFSPVVVLSDLQSGVFSGTPIGIKVEGAVFSVEGEHFGFENFATGLSISCPAGLNANMVQCPHFITLTDFQAENVSTGCVSATDFIDLKLIAPYCYGLSTSNVGIFAGSANYASSTAPSGKLKISHGMIFGFGADCILGSTGPLTDVSITDNWIYGCGLSQASGFNAINLQSTTNVVDIADNQLCSADGFPTGGAVGTEGWAIRLGANVASGLIHDNTMFKCHNGIANTSSTPFAITEHDNHGPGGLPTIASGCGTGATVSGTDQAMSISLGASASGTCLINFGTNPQMRAPMCIVTAAPGSTTTVSAVATTSQVQISGPTTGNYTLLCKTG